MDEIHLFYCGSSERQVKVPFLKKRGDYSGFLSPRFGGPISRRFFLPRSWRKKTRATVGHIWPGSRQRHPASVNLLLSRGCPPVTEPTIGADSSWQAWGAAPDGTISNSRIHRSSFRNDRPRNAWWIGEGDFKIGKFRESENGNLGGLKKYQKTYCPIFPYPY